MNPLERVPSYSTPEEEGNKEEKTPREPGELTEAEKAELSFLVQRIRAGESISGAEYKKKTRHAREILATRDAEALGRNEEDKGERELDKAA